MHRGLNIFVVLILFIPQAQYACGEVNPAKPVRNLIRSIKSTDGLVVLWLYLHPAPGFVQTRNTIRTYEN